MRINVYSQELLCDSPMKFDDMPVMGEKISNTGIRYSFVQMFLHSSDRLHRSPKDDDDDRSAITFWLPKSEERRKVLALTFELMAQQIRRAPPEIGLDWIKICLKKRQNKWPQSPLAM